MKTANAFDIMIDSQGNVDGGLSIGLNTLGQINAQVPPSMVNGQSN